MTHIVIFSWARAMNLRNWETSGLLFRNAWVLRWKDEEKNLKFLFLLFWWTRILNVRRKNFFFPTEDVISTLFPFILYPEYFLGSDCSQDSLSKNSPDYIFMKVSFLNIEFLKACDQKSCKVIFCNNGKISSHNVSQIILFCPFQVVFWRPFYEAIFICHHLYSFTFFFHYICTHIHRE